jgi:hypothetical protein
MSISPRLSADDSETKFELEMKPIVMSKGGALSTDNLAALRICSLAKSQYSFNTTGRLSQLIRLLS